MENICQIQINVVSFKLRIAFACMQAKPQNLTSMAITLGRLILSNKGASNNYGSSSNKSKL